MLAEFLTFTASCGQSDASDPILSEICTIVTVFDDTNIGEGRCAWEVDLGFPKCSDPDLAEQCTIAITFDDRNIGGRKGCSGGRFGVFKML